MRSRALAVPVGAAVLLTACVSVPSGPSVMVLPGQGKTFEQFQVEEAACRQWASQQTGTTTNQAGKENVAGSAVVGTVVGAALGAAIGAAAGSPATGAAVGAGTGLLGGTAIGAGNAQGAQSTVQRRYDHAYLQCMYAKGHQIPVARGALSAPRSPAYTSQPTAPPPPAGTPPNVPPPPAGTPPPPPPAGTPPPPPVGPAR